MTFRELIEKYSGSWNDDVPQTFEKIREKAKERYGDNAPDLSESHLIERDEKGFSQARGFLQCLPNGNYTPEMLLMAYRIAQGYMIKSIMLYHVSQSKFALAITIYEPHTPEVVDYFESENVFDFGLLKHMLTCNMMGKPVIDGFFPLKLKSTK